MNRDLLRAAAMIPAIVAAAIAMASAAAAAIEANAPTAASEMITAPAAAAAMVTAATPVASSTLTIVLVWTAVVAALGYGVVLSWLVRRRLAAAGAALGSVDKLRQRAEALAAAATADGAGVLLKAAGNARFERIGDIPADIEAALAADAERFAADPGRRLQNRYAGAGGTLYEAIGEAVDGAVAIRVRALDLNAPPRLDYDLSPPPSPGAPDSPGAPAPAASIREALDRMPFPTFVREAGGRLTWANAAYGRACGRGRADLAVADGDELLDADARAAVRRAPAGEAVRVTTVVGGKRRTFDVAVAESRGHEVAVAMDVTPSEEARARLERAVEAHATTLDQLGTAIAIFGADRKLRFHNLAYEQLWRLEPRFLADGPEEETILNRLRAAGRLPDQSDFRAWKREVTSAYEAVEGYETFWYLPDGKTLRVIATPHANGGVTYVYENVTEKVDLEARFNALMRVQSETLDNLSEGVAAFGSDGRLRLHNPAFATMWRTDEETALAGRHIRDIGRLVGRNEDEHAAWQTLADAVTSLADHRGSRSGRLNKADGTIANYASVPLPDGSTLVTFADVTDSVRVENALIERNEALIAADRLKNAFIGHVSYALRTPLNSIIGFTEMMAGGAVGPLNERQREYAGHIATSSQALRAIVDDVLDLASIDAGIMEIDRGPVDPRETIEAAKSALADQVAEAGIALDVDIAADIAVFEGDSRRIRQILFNLMSNAVAHSDYGSRIAVTCRREDGWVRFTVEDAGSGIASERIAGIFDRFVGAPTGRHRGVGLGLSIVKSFVELHGGTVDIRSEHGAGTEATVRFPAGLSALLGAPAAAEADARPRAVAR